MNWNHLNNFERGPTKDHSCEVWSNSHQWFRRRCCLKIVDRRTSGRRRRPQRRRQRRRTVSDHNSSPWAFGSGELTRGPRWPCISHLITRQIWVSWPFGSREEVQYRFSRWWPSWISLLSINKSPRYFQWRFKSIAPLVQEKKFKTDFQHGS